MYDTGNFFDEVLPCGLETGRLGQWREQFTTLRSQEKPQGCKTDGIVPDQKDAADEACDDIGIVDAESLPFMVEISFDTSVSFDDGEVITMTDKEFQEAVSESYGVPMKLVTYEGTGEELERAEQFIQAMYK
jgi:hypothetical protein